MAKGYFNITHTPTKTDIVFNSTAAANEEIPEEQQNIVMDVGNTLATIKLLYGDDSQSFKQSFEQLFYIAKIGLEGNIAQPNLATKALTQFKSEIVDKESGQIKNKYLIKLGVSAMWLGIPILLIGLLFNYLNSTKMGFAFIDTMYLANFLILWFGTMVGVWLSFTITRTYIGFEDLTIIEKDRLEPIIRLLFAGIISIVFAFLFVKKVIQLKLGNLSTDNIITDPITSFLIGTILGLNEKLLGTTLTKKTASIFDK